MLVSAVPGEEYLKLAAPCGEILKTLYHVDSWLFEFFFLFHRLLFFLPSIKALEEPGRGHSRVMDAFRKNNFTVYFSEKAFLIIDYLCHCGQTWNLCTSFFFFWWETLTLPMVVALEIHPAFII